VTAVADSASTDTDTPIDIPVLVNDYDPESDEFSLTAIVAEPAHGTVSIEDNGTPEDPSDDYVIYTADPAFVGTDTFQYEITDANDNTDIAIVTVTVAAPEDDPAPNAVADGEQTDQDIPVTIEVLGNDTHPTPGEALDITAFTQPANGTVTLDDNGTPDDPSDDTLVYTPNPGFSGNDTFMYTITDTTGDTASAAVTITVVAAPDVTIDDARITEGGDLLFNVNLSHAYGADINLTLALTDINATANEDYIASTLTVLIPAGSTQAVAAVTTLVDGIVEGDETLDISISAVNSGSVGDTSDTGRGTILDDDTPPAPEDDEERAKSGETVTIDVLENDIEGTGTLDPTTVRIIDPETGEEVTFYIVPGEGRWDVDPVTGEITFTPEEGYVGDPTPIEYIVYDIYGNSGTGTVTINYGPLAADDLDNHALEGETVIVDILANDRSTSSPLDPMSVSLVAPANATDILTDNEGDIVGFLVPSEGEWSVDEDTGAVTFVPDEDLAGNPTSVEYTVKEEDGDESNKAVIEIIYDIESGMPHATDNLNVSVKSYAPVVIDVLANGDTFGKNGPGREAIAFTQPAHGSVALDDGGTPNDPTDDVLIYTPASDISNVVDRFTYTITDALGNTSTADVSVIVDCASSQTSDSGDALGTLSIMMMMFMTLLSGLYFARKEEGENL